MKWTPDELANSSIFLDINDPVEYLWTSITPPSDYVIESKMYLQYSTTTKDG